MVLAPVAYIAALFAAAGTVALALFGGQIDGDTAPFAMGLMIGIAAYGGMISFVPALLFIIAAEIGGWRSILVYLAAGGTIGLLASITTQAFDGLAFAENLTLICVAAGFVGGAVYWLIAGKLAGLSPAAPERSASP